MMDAKINKLFSFLGITFKLSLCIACSIIGGIIGGPALAVLGALLGFTGGRLLEKHVLNHTPAKWLE